MTQTTVVFTTLPSFPWDTGDKLDAVPLNNAFIELHQLVDNLQGQINDLSAQVSTNNLAFALTVNFGGNSTPTAGPYMLIANAPYNFNILSLDDSVGTTGGSFHCTILVNGAPVDALTDFVVQTIQDEIVLPNPVLVMRGSSLSMNIDSVQGTPMNSWVNINGTTNVPPTPELGVAVGFAMGQSLAVAFGVSTNAPGQSIFMVQGKSTAFAGAMATDQGVGRSVGLSTVHFVGVQVMLGNTTASAIGGSTAHGVGSIATIPPVLVLDDPLIGLLNTNPLG